MNKYEPLKLHLKQVGLQSIPMTFAEIEALVGESLPNSAFKHRPWWSNNPSNSVITKAWLEAGYKTSAVDMEGQKLIFRKTETPMRGFSDASANSTITPMTQIKFEDLYGCMKTSISVSVDFNPTQSTGEHWDAESGQR